MPAFRLKMAAQRGEQIAAEFGFKQFPVRPREIAHPLAALTSSPSRPT